MKRLQVVKVDLLDGGTHFVLLESKHSKKHENAEDYDEIEVKKESKNNVAVSYRETATFFDKRCKG